LGLLVNQFDEASRKQMSREFETDVRFDILGGEEFELQLAAVAACLEIVFDAQERTALAQELFGSIRDHDEERHRLKSADDVTEQIDRRNVPPMHVIEKKDQRLVARRLLQERHELPLEPLLAASAHVADEMSGGKGFGARSGELRVPERGDRPQRARKGAPASAATA